MNQANRMTGFGGLFPTQAARTAPVRGLPILPPADRAPVGSGLGRWLGVLRQAFELRRDRARTQRLLAHLDDRLLRDIGLSRADLGVRLEPPFQGLGEALRRERAGLWHL